MSNQSKSVSVYRPTPSAHEAVARLAVAASIMSWLAVVAFLFVK
jgi:hypothetical protein